MSTSRNEIEPLFREATLDDRRTVSALKEKYGFGSDTSEKWSWLWKDNPAVGVKSFRPSLGWVVEISGEVVGYLGNFPMLYRYGDQTLIAAVGHAFVVKEAYRGYGINLAASFMRQKDSDFLLLSTMNAVAHKIFSFFGARRIPLGDWNEGLFWVVTPSKALEGFLRHRLPGGFPAKLGAALLSPVLWSEGSLKRRGPRRFFPEFSIEVLDREAIGEDFDDLWARKLRERPRLMAYRTAESLRWYLGVPGVAAESMIFTCKRSSDLVGFAIVKRTEMLGIPATSARVMDLFVESDEPAIVESLLRGIWEYSKTAGDGILIFGMGFPEEIRDTVRSLRPHVRPAEGAPGVFKAVGEAGATILATENAWYCSPMDGDGFLS